MDSSSAAVMLETVQLESGDEAECRAVPTLAAGRRWSPREAVLQNQDVKHSQSEAEQQREERSCRGEC